MSGRKKVIIVDTYSPRGEEVAGYLHKRANVSFIPMDEEEMESAQSEFTEQILDALEGNEAVTVICNSVAVIRGEIFALLDAAEEAQGVLSQRMILSCYSKARVKRDLKSAGISRSGFRHIEHDDRGHYLEALDNLFN